MKNTDDYEKMCNYENIKRAYRWIVSNPNAIYKNYFRDSYEAYAAALEYNIKRLRRDLLHKTYNPSHASKIYFPKSSGILRPYTLLTVNDRITYQACINIIAEKLFPKVKNNYLNKSFGNLYAGKSSLFFYRKWQNCYKSYSKSIIKNINEGFNFIADFDLANFYDSIDHNVLKQFLLELQIDNDLIEFLLECLRIWSSSTWHELSNVIYHGHGIPQGPLASGLLSEVVLKFIDDLNNNSKKSNVKYLRYVDDIKLFAKSEDILRQKLVFLDISSKQIGLFPQSSKINIHKAATNPLDEIKTVSDSEEPGFTSANQNQNKLRKRLREIIKNNKVDSKNNTIFKRTMAITQPHFSLNLRVIKLLYSQPEFFQQIALYFSKYKKLPQKTAKLLFEYIKATPIYHTVHAAILFAILDNMPATLKADCAKFCYDKLLNNKKKSLSLQFIYKAALIAWCLENNRLTYKELLEIINNETNRWVRKDILKYIKKDMYGDASYQNLLNIIIQDSDPEPARVAAYKIIVNDTKLSSYKFNSFKKIQESARILLYSAGGIRNIGPSKNFIGITLDNIFYQKKENFAKFDWRNFFDSKYINAEKVTIEIKAGFESDINKCIVTLDNLCDLIWQVLFKKELPQKVYGNYGSMLNNMVLTRKYAIAAQWFLFTWFKMRFNHFSSRKFKDKVMHKKIKAQRL